MAETQEQRVARVLQDRIALATYDIGWPAGFATEAAHLRQVLPTDLLGRIEHYGSTAVPGLPAKPIIDLLIEVHDEDRARVVLETTLRPPAYDYFWRPIQGDHGPCYSWLIKRDALGQRTHHLHCVPPGHQLWEALRFRDALRADPALAAAYARLKSELAERFSSDRVGYYQGKSEFIRTAMQSRGMG